MRGAWGAARGTSFSYTSMLDELKKSQKKQFECYFSNLTAGCPPWPVAFGYNARAGTEMA